MSMFGEPPSELDAPRPARGARITPGALTLAVVAAIVGGLALFLVGMEVGRRQGVDEGLAMAREQAVPAESILGPERNPTAPPSASGMAAAVAPPAVVEALPPEGDPTSTVSLEPAPSTPAGSVEAPVPPPPVEATAAVPTPADGAIETASAAAASDPEAVASWERAVRRGRAIQAAGGAWVVQVLATPDEVKARLLAQQLEAAGYPVFLTPTRKDSLTWHRVRVGSYSARAEAVRVAGELRRRFDVQTWVID